MPLDLGSIAQILERGVGAVSDLLEAVLERIEKSASSSAWIYLVPKADVRAQFAKAVEKRSAGALPLFGVPFAVKDNIDVAGMPTSAACPAFQYTAERTAPVVQRLIDAGAILVGKTNLDQFACGLAGDRTPYGICRNPFNADYIAGGSSSGSALAVAAGLVTFALGTDTAGSGRVPAACTNIVGLKPTPGLLSTEGVVPACRSLDCVSIFAQGIDDAERVFDIAVGSRGADIPVCRSDGRQESLPHGTGEAIAYAVPRDEDLEFFGDAGQQQLFRDSLARLDSVGWKRVTFDLRPFRQVASMLYEGPWVAERYAAVGTFVEKHPEAVHPITRAIILDGAKYTAADLFKAQYELRALRETCLKVFDRAAVLVVPGVPALPTVAQVESDSRGWGRRLGHYTNFVNLLGLAAVGVPAGFTSAGLPGGLTLIGPAGSDRKLCRLGAVWQNEISKPRGRAERDPGGCVRRNPRVV
jgi:allophanate hydrolase